MFALRVLMQNYKVRSFIMPKEELGYCMRKSGVVEKHVRAGAFMRTARQH